MSGSDVELEISALAINVTIPDELRWTDTRRGEEFTLTTLNVRLLKDGTLAAKAYGRPTAGGRGTLRVVLGAEQTRPAGVDQQCRQPRR